MSTIGRGERWSRVSTTSAAHDVTLLPSGPRGFDYTREPALGPTATIGTRDASLVMAAADLLTFTQNLALRGRHAIAEPKALRYQLLHVAGRIVRTGRQTVMHLQADWPWTHVLLAAFRQLRSLPTPAT